MNFIQISKEQFYNYFSNRDYLSVSWAGRTPGVPEPPYRQAHLNWVFDTVTNQYVGYELSSSWNDGTRYTILEELTSAEMLEWNKLYLAEEKIRQEKADAESKEYWTKHPPKPYDPTKPRLLEFLENGNVIEYNPSIDNLMDALNAYGKVFSPDAFEIELDTEWFPRPTWKNRILNILTFGWYKRRNYKTYDPNRT
jgi:hypothetical protein